MSKSSDKARSEEHTSELQSRQYLVCRLLLEKKKKTKNQLFETTFKTKNTFIKLENSKHEVLLKLNTFHCSANEILSPLIAFSTSSVCCHKRCWHIVSNKSKFFPLFPD